MPTEKKSDAAQFLEGLVGPLTFGGMLANERECEGWSQAALARRLGVTPQHLCDVEKGRKAVSPERAAAWARELGYSEAQFVELALQAQVDAAGLKLAVHVGGSSEPPASKKKSAVARPARKKTKARASA
jgi:transcriptional regulator with XRE-family HTH domain